MKKISKPLILAMAIVLAGVIGWSQKSTSHSVAVETHSDPESVTPEQMYEGAYLVIEATVLDEEDALLTIKPKRIWKGDKSQIENKLALFPDCKKWFKKNVDYVFFLPRKAGGTYNLNFCAARAIESSSESALNFLIGQKAETLSD